MKGNFGKLVTILLPLIVAAVVLYPTYKASQLEKSLGQTIQEASQEKTAADSLETVQNWYRENGEEFSTAKSRRIKLGLDLRGGMYVTLEVDVAKLIEETAQKEAIDEIFEEVMTATREEIKDSDERTLDVFLRKFEEIATPQGRSLISYFDVGNVREASEEATIEKLEENAASAIDQALEVIRQRIDKYGVSEPNIQKQGSRRILLELPGVTNEAEMRQLLSTTARLEFNLVKNNQDIARAFKLIDERLSESGFTSNTEEVAANETEIASDSSSEESSTLTENENEEIQDTTNEYEGLSQEEALAKYQKEHPFTSLFYSYYIIGEDRQMQPIDYTINLPDGEYFFQIHQDSIPKFNEILSRPEIKNLLPYNIKVAFHAKANELETETGEKVSILNFYALKEEPELIGDVITDARKDMDQTNNSWVVVMGMNTEGSERWATITGANVGKQVAIVLDGRVYSAPTVQQKISGGSSQISGMENVKEASLLEIVLKAGALKAPVQIIEENVVGASLGQDSINNGIQSSYIAFGLVILFMLFYYMRGGLVADMALFINITLIFTILASLKGTLTLPGIAGVILTMGMAVDANILIFERIREELLKGRSLKSAIDEGYKNARSAIFDSNITTLITGMILFYFGSGMIKGFALTLVYGILSTLFTAIVVTRAFIALSVSSGASSFSFGQPKNNS